jgi:hypothetical protein
MVKYLSCLKRWSSEQIPGDKGPSSEVKGAIEGFQTQEQQNEICILEKEITCCTTVSNYRL